MEVAHTMEFGLVPSVAIALDRVFHLDYVGAQLCQEMGGKWA
jgi:hypothetical protein